jgi:hypothetical protein
MFGVNRPGMTRRVALQIGTSGISGMLAGMMLAF